MQKKTVLLLFLFFICGYSFSQTQTPVYLSQSITNGNSKGFYQYLPADYSSSTKNYPLIIWVHGAGQVGQGNSTDLPKVLEWGVPKIISGGGFPSSFTVADSSFSFIIISPQFMGWPSGNNISAILSYAMNNYRVNPDKVYLMGISAGGGGVWDFASTSTTNSNKLAAIIPFCGTLAPTQTLANRIATSNLPVWAFHNTNDGTVPVAYSRNWKSYINAYLPTPNPLAKLTEFSTVSNDAIIAHECWSLATLPTYKPEGKNIYEWLLQYRKRTASLNLSPLASAGQDQGVVLPLAALLDGSASVDQDGVIVSYKWRKIIGPSSYLFSDSTSIKPTVSNLVQGVYQFELSVTDNLAATSKDSITVNVYANLPVGAQQRILIDVGGTSSYGGTITTSPSINGNVWNNMTDARAGVRVTNALTINNQLSGLSVEVINRVDGTYSTGSLGIGNGNTVGIVSDYPASATTDHALIHRSATNGKWRIKGLVTNKIYVVKFWGTRSNTTASRNAEIKRSDDNVWKSYNATGNTNYNNAAVFNITGKTEMDFDIRTKAGSDFSTINVLDISYGSDTTIVPPTTVNLPPVARAGADTSLQLPVDSLILTGCTSSDPENAILKYKWRKISGPSAYQFVTDTLCYLNVKGLFAGIYSFELLVTDTAGLSSKDSVTVNINALVTTNWPPQVTPLCNRAFKLVIVGSSTAYGTGANPIDSSWVRKFKDYLLIQNQQIQIINIATLGLTSYDVSPTGTIVPAPFTVDSLRNITKALSLNPDAIILSLPSNDVARGIPTSTIHNNYNTIAAAAEAQQVPIWVTTTQPRNGLSTAERLLQMDLRDWINTTYGNKSVDYWTTVSNADGTINSFFAAGDGIHLNNYGHHVLFTRIVEEKIWDTICKRKNAAPIARAGNDTTISGSYVSFILNGLASYDPDGTITEYSWRIINNLNVNLTSINTGTPVFTTNNSGTYLVELKITDNLGRQALDSISISIYSPNIIPVANAGTDILTQQVSDSIQLNGAASLDPDGIIIKFKWKKLNGPFAIISNDSISKPWIKGILAGTYNFKLTVTDDSLDIDTDTIQLIVNANPLANAGTDQTITLPNQFFQLNGTASTDFDGTIVSYLWGKISGPGTVSITDSSASQTNGNILSAGLYEFELTVKDNFGALGKDTIRITVHPNPNNPPVANAGVDKSIQLPENKVLLDGRSSFDPEGAAIIYNWALVTGPTGSQVLTASKDSTTVTFVNSGQYTFSLTITDTSGLTSIDNIIITVLPIPDIAKKIKVNIYGVINPYTNTQWNNWNILAGTTTAKFLYENSSLSNINASITAAGIIVDNGVSYATTSTVCPTQVLRYNSANTSIRTLTFGGCNTTKQYSFEFYASRSNTGNSTAFSIGSKSDTISTNSNINDYAKFINISPDNAGKIIVNIKSIGTWNYLAGFMITEQENAVTLISARPSLLDISSDETIAENLKTTSLEVYPNPVNDIFYIRIPEEIEGKYSIILIDIYGKTVINKTGTKVIGSFQEMINIKSLLKGLYALRFLQKNKRMSRTIIKL